MKKKYSAQYLWKLKAKKAGEVAGRWGWSYKDWKNSLPAYVNYKSAKEGREDPLEGDVETYSTILAWQIPRTEEPGRLQPMGSQRVRHHWGTEHAMSLKQKENDCWKEAWVSTHKETTRSNNYMDKYIW